MCKIGITNPISKRLFFDIYIYIYMTINLHFTSRKNVDKKHRQTKLHDPQIPIPKSNWENKITNDNNKYIV